MHQSFVTTAPLSPMFNFALSPQCVCVWRGGGGGMENVVDSIYMFPAKQTWHFNVKCKRLQGKLVQWFYQLAVLAVCG